MLDISLEILLLAPAPTATMEITAPTPMIIPSMVSAERTLFIQRALSDIFIMEGMLIIEASASGTQGMRSSYFIIDHLYLLFSFAWKVTKHPESHGMVSWRDALPGPDTG